MLTRAYKKIVLSGWTLKTDGDYALSYTGTASFADGGSISDFAKESVSFMASNGILKGVDDSHFDPSNSVTAEQVLAIAVRMIKNLDASPQENAKTNTNTDTESSGGGAQADPGALTNGYMKKAGIDSMSYGTLAHELFHFVERCYPRLSARASCTR